MTDDLDLAAAVRATGPSDPTRHSGRTASGGADGGPPPSGITGPGSGTGGSSPSGPDDSDPTNPAEAVLRDAARLARRGRYDAARRHVETLAEPGVAGHDLLARIAAQTGDLDAAERHWNTVAETDPAHAGARDGRHTIAGLRNRPPRRRRRGLIVGIAVVALLAGAAAGAGFAGDDDSAIARRLDQLESLLAQSESDTPEPEPSTDPIDDLAARLTGDGWDVAVDDGTATIRFDEPLFAPGTADLTGTGTDTIADLAAVLPASDTDVTVIGHTSDLTPSGGGYLDNVSLALARGQSGAEQLADSADIPLSTINVASAGASDPPYPNTDDDGRTRNQTITIEVRPA